MAGKVKKVLDPLKQEIGAAYDPDASTAKYLRWNYGGKEGLTTKEFIRILKQKHPPLANVKDTSVSPRLSHILHELGLRDTWKGDHARSKGFGEASDSNSEARSVTLKIPDGAWAIQITTRDPDTEVSFMRAESVRPFNSDASGGEE